MKIRSATWAGVLHGEGVSQRRDPSKVVVVACRARYGLSEQADTVVRGALGAVGHGQDYVRAKCC